MRIEDRLIRDLTVAEFIEIGKLCFKEAMRELEYESKKQKEHEEVEKYLSGNNQPSIKDIVKKYQNFPAWALKETRAPWQTSLVTTKVEHKCHKCKKELPKGSKAVTGLLAPPKAMKRLRIWYCPTCFNNIYNDIEHLVREEREAETDPANYDYDDNDF